VTGAGTNDARTSARNRLRGRIIIAQLYRRRFGENSFQLQAASFQLRSDQMQRHSWPGRRLEDRAERGIETGGSEVASAAAGALFTNA
jgi:hypothetical protein